jgi:hypothetical protein
MKNQIVSAIAICLLLSACQSQQEMNAHIGLPTQVKPQMPIKDVYKIASTKSQKFTINTEQPTKIIGKQGTIIYIDAGCLTDENGNVVQGQAEIELVELYSKSSMFFNNKPTVSDGELLVSGGQIFVQAYQNKKPLLIGCPQGVAIQMSKELENPYEFDVFNGEPQNDGTVNWRINENQEGWFYELAEQEPQQTQQDPDVEGEGNWNEEETSPYFRFATKQFGWINCDKFYDLDVEKQDLVVQLKKKPQGKDYQVKVVAFFDKLLAVMNAYPDAKGNFTLQNVPIGEPVTVLAVVANKTSIYFAQQKVKHTGKKEVEVELLVSTPEAVKKQIEKLN